MNLSYEVPRARKRRTSGLWLQVHKPGRFTFPKATCEELKLTAGSFFKIGTRNFKANKTLYFVPTEDNDPKGFHLSKLGNNGNSGGYLNAPQVVINYDIPVPSSYPLEVMESGGMTLYKIKVG